MYVYVCIYIYLYIYIYITATCPAGSSWRRAWHAARRYVAIPDCAARGAGEHRCKPALARAVQADARSLHDAGAAGAGKANRG